MVYKQGDVGDRSKENRKKFGKLIKECRIAADLTQKDIADAIGLPYYTMISQFENGYSRIPPDLFKKYAKALKVDEFLFVKENLRYNDPHTFSSLFGREKALKAADLVV